MKAKAKEFANGAWTHIEQDGIFYVVKLYAPNGDLREKIKTDSRKSAQNYWIEFNALAVNI